MRNIMINNKKILVVAVLFVTIVGVFLCLVISGVFRESANVYEMEHIDTLYLFSFNDVEQLQTFIDTPSLETVLSLDKKQKQFSELTIKDKSDAFSEYFWIDHYTYDKGRIEERTEKIRVGNMNLTAEHVRKLTDPNALTEFFNKNKVSGDVKQMAMISVSPYSTIIYWVQTEKEDYYIFKYIKYNIFFTDVYYAYKTFTSKNVGNSIDKYFNNNHRSC